MGVVLRVSIDNSNIIDALVINRVTLLMLKQLSYIMRWWKCYCIFSIVVLYTDLKLFQMFDFFTDNN